MPIPKNVRYEFFINGINKFPVEENGNQAIIYLPEIDRESRIEHNLFLTLMFHQILSPPGLTLQIINVMHSLTQRNNTIFANDLVNTFIQNVLRIYDNIQDSNEKRRFFENYLRNFASDHQNDNNLISLISCFYNTMVTEHEPLRIFFGIGFMRNLLDGINALLIDEKKREAKEKRKSKNKRRNERNEKERNEMKKKLFKQFKEFKIHQSVSGKKINKKMIFEGNQRKSFRNSHKNRFF